MDNRRVVKTKGIVLSEVNFSESDKMLTILTPDLGKISCVAKGARRMQSKILASSQLFAFSEFILFKGAGESYYINSAELIESFYAIRKDYDKLGCAMNCTGFIKKYVQENQLSISMLKLILNTIYLLSVSEGKNSLIETVFQLKATCLLGYTPNFDNCIVCKSKETPAGFSIRQNGVICEPCGRTDKSIIGLSPAAIAAIIYVIRSDLKKIFSFSVNEDVIKEIELFNKIYIESKLNS